EKIEALADLDSAADSLRTAVGSLLGLDLVGQLQTDLAAVQRRVLRGSQAASSKELEKREAALATASDLADQAKQRLEQLERELGEAREENVQIRSASRAAGGELVAQRDDLEAEAKQARAAEAEVWDGLRELAADPLGPIALVPKLLEGLVGTAR